MFRKISDSNIINGIRQQDEKTLNWLYENYLPVVRQQVLKNSGSEEDVHDVFQESVIALYNRVSDINFKPESDLKGYFYGIARNIWNLMLRHKKRILLVELDMVEEYEEEEVQEYILDRIVARAFLKLTSDARTILTLFADGMSYAEIAEKMNLKNEAYARRKKFLSKEALIDLVRKDPEYKDYFSLK